jgi:adenylate cyclase
MERRLSAVMAADVVGYSRLMGSNEVATLTALKEHRAQLVDPSIAKHQGRIVKLTGDGMLVEFSSVVGAVECASQIQRDMRNRNADVADDRKIEFRIGINLGDVIVDDDDIFGDGVNVAARLEGVAKPGGIAVSSAVRENVGNKLDLVFEDMGDQDLKNIAFPVRAFNVVVPSSNGDDAEEAEPEEAEKPSIAVLPFNNMSGDTEQEYFSDGITEDIITDLSKVSGLFVVGRNTSFTYKGKALQLQQVAAELGVKFLLEGSVRKAGQRVRVTGQLIDGTTGGHLWADRYDRDLTDIFEIQDEITTSIVDQLKIRLLPKEKKAIEQAPTVNIEAYNSYLKGRQLYHAFTKSYLILAKEMFAKAVEIDPNYARAYAGMASSMSRLWGMYNVPTNLSEAHATRGEALANSGRRPEAAAAFERALDLDPNSFDASLSYARYCVTEGRYDKAIELYTRATEIQPDDSQAPMLLQIVYRALGRFDESEKYGRLGVKRAEEQLKLHPENSRPAQLGAATLASLGEKDLALKWLERAKLIDPDDNNARYNAACTYAQIGEIDQAVDMLEEWAKHCGAEQEMWFLNDSDLDPVREHARYPVVLQKLKERVSTVVS